MPDLAMFSLSEEHKMIRDAARDFAQNEIVPVAAEFDESGEFPHATIKKMGEMGFMGIEMPEEYGGAGMGTLSYVLALEEICKADAAHGVIMSVNNSLYCHGVIAGSATYALATRTFRWEGFRDAEDTAKHVIGGILMGFGGITALGCTIGQAVTGISTLALGSLSLVAACGGDPCDPDAPNTICTIAGSGEQGFGGDDGPATKAALYVPQDMAVAPNGNVWVLDFNNYMVREIKPDGDIHCVVGNGLLGDSPPPELPSMPAIEARSSTTRAICSSAAVTCTSPPGTTAHSSGSTMMSALQTRAPQWFEANGRPVIEHGYDPHTAKRAAP